MTETKPDDERVTYVKTVVYCQECGRPIDLVKCKCCHNADNLPPALVQFGELVRPEVKA